MSAGAIVIATLVSIGGAVAAGPSGVVVSRELLEAAAARGSARVVVQLAVSGAADAATVGAVKQALWSALAGTTYRVVRDLPGLPVVVLDASPETLGVLASSPAVVHVSEDEIRRPQR